MSQENLNQTTQTSLDEEVSVTSVEVSETETHEEEHAGPHIPLIQGETVWGPISNVTLTIIVFSCIIFAVSLMARSSLKKGKGKLRLVFLSMMQFADTYLRDSFGDKKTARKYFPLIVGMFFIIFFGNMLGLLIDWAGMSISPTILSYLRPMHSDMNTTLILAVVTMVTYIGIQIKSHGGLHAGKSYLFNFTGNNIGEKLINVFVGWLHFIGIFATTASLSLRLFGNIFAGVVLIGIITYLGAFASSALFNFVGLGAGGEIGRFLSIPFWFFEVFVSLIQAIVFVGIMIAQFKSAKEAH